MQGIHVTNRVIIASIQETLRFQFVRIMLLLVVSVIAVVLFYFVLFRILNPPISFDEIDRQSCLSDIKPGTSTEFQFTSTLMTCQHISRYRMDSFRRSSIDPNIERAHSHFWLIDGDSTAFVTAASGEILSKTLFPKSGISAGDVLNEYGTPEAWERSAMNDPHACHWSIGLLYFRRGMAFYFEVLDQQCGYAIPYWSQAAYRYYQFIPGNMDDYIRSGGLVDLLTLAFLKEHLYSWSGYDAMRGKPGKQ